MWLSEGGKSKLAIPAAQPESAGLLRSQKTKNMGGPVMAEEDTNLAEGPLWLKPLLKADFFATCGIHGVSTKSECNLFCFNCMGDGICASCAVDHKDHHVVQIRDRKSVV